MKKETLKRHSKIANDIKHYIYKHIDIDINLYELSINLGISKFHMHRIFKNEFNKNIYESIKEIRLTKSSTLLLTNKNSTITSIAKMCGYTSHGAFIRVFKQNFYMTPSKWRKGGYKDLLHLSKNFDKFSIEPTIVKKGGSTVHYIRHRGYGKSTKKIWEKLNLWLLCNDIKEYKKVGFYHDIPLLKDYNNCRYTAGIITDEDFIDSPFPNFVIEKNVYAKFDYKGSKEEFLNFINWIHFVWLIKSGYETTPVPSFVEYESDYLENDKEMIHLNYYVSVAI